jgi:hypothetical protein
MPDPTFPQHGGKVERSGENRERNARCLTLPIDT